MKLMAQLALSKDQFQLDINGDDVFDLQRYVEEEEKKEGDTDALQSAKKISAAKFNVNDLEILETGVKKSLRGLQAAIDRQMEEAKEAFAKNIAV